MNFEKRKAMKKIVEDFEQGNLVEPTHSNWAAQISSWLQRNEHSE